MPRTYVFIAFYESYSKGKSYQHKSIFQHIDLAGYTVFFNALLAMLNARSKLSRSGVIDSRSTGHTSSNGSGKVNMLRLPGVGLIRGMTSTNAGQIRDVGDDGVSMDVSKSPEMYDLAEIRKVSVVDVA